MHQIGYSWPLQQNPSIHSSQRGIVSLLPINTRASVRIRLPEPKSLVPRDTEEDAVFPAEHDISDGISMATKNDALRVRGAAKVKIIH
jgi:hypothetical protein